MHARWLKMAGMIALTNVVVIVAAWMLLSGRLFASQSVRTAIESRYTAWHQALVDKRFADAYAYMAPDYRKSHSLAEFSEEMKHWGEPHLRLQKDYGLRVYGYWAWLYPYKIEPFELLSGPDFEWVKVDGVWYLTGEYKYYLD